MSKKGTLHTDAAREKGVSQKGAGSRGTHNASSGAKRRPTPPARTEVRGGHQGRSGK